MSIRLRSTSLAGVGALSLVLTFAGLAAGRVVLTDQAPAPEVTTPDTTASFEDLNGNGIDDACEVAGTVVADPVAAETALTAADLDGDGVISITEAARSGWTGGENCNHGGYVSWVAHNSPADTSGTAATDAAKAAAKAAKEAAKAAAKAARAEEKAARQAARDAAKAARDAAKAERKAGHAAAKAAKLASKKSR